jgi:glycosyltransferase involved in cell wall biosynthesis
MYSIIIPSYNQGQFIQQTIDSILSNNNKKEIIVYDNLSSDNTLSILNTFSKNIDYTSESDSGQTNAINKGIVKSKGDIISYLNSDDLYFHNTLDIVEKYKDLEWDFLIGSCMVIDENNRTIGKFLPIQPKLNNLLNFWKWERSWCVPQPSVFIRRNVFDKIGLFKEELHYVMDWEFWVRGLLNNLKFKVINEPISMFRSHNTQKTVTGQKKLFHEATQITKNYIDNLNFFERNILKFKLRKIENEFR